MSSYSIAGINFDKSTEIHDYVKGMLDKQYPGEELSGQDFEFIKEVISYHPIQKTIKDRGEIKTIYITEKPNDKELRFEIIFEVEFDNRKGRITFKSSECIDSIRPGLL